MSEAWGGEWLVWAEQRRVITGSDILERLLQGITPLRVGTAKA